MIYFWIIGLVFTILYYKNRIKTTCEEWLITLLFTMVVFAYKILYILINDNIKKIQNSLLLEIIKSYLFIVVLFVLVLKAGIYLNNKEKRVNSVLLIDKTQKVRIYNILIVTFINLAWMIAVFKLFRISKFIEVPINHAILSINYYIYIGFIGPLTEEIQYRFTMIPLLLLLFSNIKYKNEICILLSSVFFVIPHISRIDNYTFARILQLLPFGISLGYISIKKNIEECIIAHMLYNICGTILVSYV